MVTSDSCNMVFENVGKAFNGYIFEPSQTNVSLRYLLSNWYKVFRETWPTTEDARGSIASIGRLWQVLHSQNLSKYCVYDYTYIIYTVCKKKHLVSQVKIQASPLRSAHPPLLKLHLRATWSQWESFERVVC